MCLVRPEQQLMVLPRAMAAGTAAARAAKPAPPIGSGAFPAAGGAIGAQPAFGAQGQAAPGLPIPAFGFGAAVQPPPPNLMVSALGHTAQLAAAIPGVPSFPAAASSSTAPFGFAAAASSSAAPFGFAAAPQVLPPLSALPPPPQVLPPL